MFPHYSNNLLCSKYFLLYTLSCAHSPYCVLASIYIFCQLEGQHLYIIQTVSSIAQFKMPCYMP